MKRDELGDLMAFLAVCEERSFTRAAARLGTSQSSLSHTVKRLEARLDLRLLTRTTRNVSPTPAGEQLAATLRPAFDDISARLASLDAMRARPAGLVRITTSRHAALAILWPKLSPVLEEYPEIRLELAVEQGMTDIVEGRFDAGVRPGGAIGFVGVPHGVTFDGQELFFAQRQLLGGPAPVRRFLPDLIDGILKREFNPGKVFDLEIDLKDVAEGYAAMDERRAIKTLLRV